MSDVKKGLKKSAAMVILRHEQQLLLLERAKPPNRGMYVPVGGKLEPFEDPYTAARREAKEETGIDIDHLKFAGLLVETSPTEYNWQSYIYIADIAYQTAPACDEGTLHWVDFDRINTLPTPPTDEMIYQYIVRGQVFAFNARLDAELRMLEMYDEILGKRVL